MGHHDGDMPVEKMDVNGEGDLIASIGKDNLNSNIGILTRRIRNFAHKNTKHKSNFMNFFFTETN